MRAKEQILLSKTLIVLVLLLCLSLGNTSCRERDTSESIYNPVPTFVAVGNSGAVIYSTDGGENWTPGNSGTQNDLRSVASNGKGRFVAVGSYGTVIYSIDGGANWIEGNPGTDEALRSIASSGNGRLVAVGFNGTAIYSTDGGDSWTTGDMGAVGSPINFYIRTVAYDGSGTWLAAGRIGHPISGIVIKSTDGGISWEATASEFPFTEPVQLVRRPDRWIILSRGAQGGLVYESEDGGASWELVYEPNDSISKLGYDGSQTLARVGYCYQRCIMDIAYNDLDCESIPVVGPCPLYLRSIAFGEDRWVAVGTRMVVYYSQYHVSTMGIVDYYWNRGNTPSERYEELQDVAYGLAGNIMPLLFYEDFEDGDWLGWGDAGGGYTISIVPTSYLPGGSVPEGNYNLSLTGGNIGGIPFSGIYKLLPNITPSHISFYVRSSTSADGRHGDFVLRQSDNEGIEFAFNANANGQAEIQVNDQLCGDYSHDRWYLVEFKNIDWAIGALDVHVDGVQCIDELAFVSPVPNFDRLGLFNTNHSQVWIDEIEMWE